MQLPPGSIIATGPVIIENGKVLLNREEKPIGSELYMFPGGTVKDFALPLEESCRREAREEMGIGLNNLRPLRMLVYTRPEDKKLIILAHYLAERVGEIAPGAETLEWHWFDIHELPANCAPNV